MSFGAKVGNLGRAPGGDGGERGRRDVCSTFGHADAPDDLPLVHERLVDGHGMEWKVEGHVESPGLTARPPGH